MKIEFKIVDQNSGLKTSNFQWDYANFKLISNLIFFNLNLVSNVSKKNKNGNSIISEVFTYFLKIQVTGKSDVSDIV